MLGSKAMAMCIVMMKPTDSNWGERGVTVSGALPSQLILLASRDWMVIFWWFLWDGLKDFYVIFLKVKHEIIFHHLELITGIGSFSFIFICHCGFPRLNEPGPFIYSTYIVDPGFGTSDEAISETWKNHFSRSKIDSSQEIWNIRGPKLHFNFHKIQQVWGFLRQDVERFASQKVLVDFKDGIKIAKSRTSSIICQGVSGSIIGSTWKVIFFQPFYSPNQATVGVHSFASDLQQSQPGKNFVNRRLWALCYSPF